MSIQNEINRINNDLDTQTDLIASIKFVLQSKGYIVTAVMAAGEVWYKATNTNKADITTINIEKSYTPSTYDECWDASASGDGSVMAYVEGNKLTIAGDGSSRIKLSPNMKNAFSDFTSVTSINNIDLLKTSDVTNFTRFFYNCTSLQNLDLTSWDTSSCENMTDMFYKCNSLGALDVSNWNISSCKNISGMFDSCWTLTTLDVRNWDTSSVSDMAYVFNRCVGLVTLDLSKWDVSNVTSMKLMLSGHSSVGNMSLASIGDVSKWDTGSCENIEGMFQKCTSLKELDVSNWNTSACKNMSYMFNDCTSLATLDVSKWDTSSCENMQSMFNNCTSLATLDVSKWDTSSCKNMPYMFNDCTSLATLDVSKWDTSSCKNMSYMFNRCLSLNELDVATKKINKDAENEYTAWDVSNVLNFTNMFSMAADNNQGSGNPALSALDVSGWDTSNSTDMSFMFYGCRLASGTVDVSGWNVSKVTAFDHMFAHSMLNIGDTSNWKVTTACTNLNALFLSVQNTSLDVSGFDTSNVTVFEQMFQGCTLLTEIIGLENFDTSKGLGFSEMFQNCWKLKKLNLSSFDTTKAKDGAPASTNGTVTNTLNRMFDGMRVLEEITLGANFSFDGDGTAPDSAGILPTPDPSYIQFADGGCWYTIDGIAYTPAEIQAMDNPAGTYYAMNWSTVM